MPSATLRKEWARKKAGTVAEAAAQEPVQDVSDTLVEEPPAPEPRPEDEVSDENGE